MSAILCVHPPDGGRAHAALADTPFHAALVSLEAAGVPLLLCGTCLDHYGIAEKTLVGTVADMGTIAAALSNADKVITI